MFEKRKQITRCTKHVKDSDKKGRTSNHSNRKHTKLIRRIVRVHETLDDKIGGGAQSAANASHGDGKSHGHEQLSDWKLLLKGPSFDDGNKESNERSVADEYGDESNGHPEPNLSLKERRRRAQNIFDNVAKDACFLNSFGNDKVGPNSNSSFARKALKSVLQRDDICDIQKSQSEPEDERRFLPVCRTQYE